MKLTIATKKPWPQTPRKQIKRISAIIWCEDEIKIHFIDEKMFSFASLVSGARESELKTDHIAACCISLITHDEQQMEKRVEGVLNRFFRVLENLPGK